jgi:hypothetical protein
MQEGQVVYARENKVPSAASLSKVGVRTTGCFKAERQSPRIWSGMISRMSGCLSEPHTKAVLAPSTKSERKIVFTPAE